MLHLEILIKFLILLITLVGSLTAAYDKYIVYLVTLKTYGSGESSRISLTYGSAWAALFCSGSWAFSRLHVDVRIIILSPVYWV